MKPIFVITENHIETRGLLPLDLNNAKGINFNKHILYSRARELNCLNKIYIAEGRDFFLLVYPRDIKIHTFCLEFNIVNDKASCACRDIAVLEFNTHYEIYVDYYKREMYALKQHITKVNDYDLTTTFFYDGVYKIACFTQFEYFEKEVPNHVNTEIYSLTEDNTLLIICKGENSDKKSFLLIISYYEGKFSELNYIENIDVIFEKEHILTTKYLHDMLSRKITTYYKLEKNGLSEIKTQFIYDNNINYINSLYPCLFLEALQCNDLEKAETYLSNELLGDSKIIKEYLGSYSSFYPLNTSNFILYNTNQINNKQKKVMFSLKDGLINNIDLRDNEG